MELLEYKNSAVKLYFGTYALETYLNVRQHRKLLEKEVPKAVQDIVSAEKFEKERLIELDESYLRFVKGIWKVAKNYVFIKYDIYPRLWRYSSGILVEYLGLNGSLWYTDYFIASAVFPMANAISGLPVLLYELLIVLKRRGLNPTTESKGEGTSVRSPPQVSTNLDISTTLDVLPQLYFINQGVQNSYFYVWLFRFARNTIYTLFPGFLAKFCLKTHILPEGELKTKIEALAKKTGFPLNKLLIYQKVRGADSSNIFILGKFNTKNIFLSNAIVEKSTVEEVCALISVELGIWKSNLGLKKVILNEVCSLGILYALSTTIQNQDFYKQFGFDTMPVIFGCTMFKVFITPLKPVVNSLCNLISRKITLQANAFAKSLGYTETLKSSIIKSYHNQMYNFNTDPLYSVYHSQTLSLTEHLQSIGKSK